MMENRFENFTFYVLKANKLIQRIKNKKIEEFDTNLKAVHVMCIHLLNAEKEGLTNAEIVRGTLEDKAAISRALAQLKEWGYVSYEKRERGGKILLTQEGKRAADYISQAAQQAVDIGGKDLTEAERDIFYRCLKSITENLSAFYEREYDR